MKLNDALSGLIVTIAGLAIVLHARTFPPMPGQPVGPSFFPSVIGGALVLLGAALLFGGAHRRGVPWVEFEDWVRRPRMAANLALTIGLVLAYSLAVDRLGFLITAILFLSLMFLAFGVTRAWILPVAIAVTLAIHYGFYSLLRVPLPWGVLEAIAW